MTKRSTAVTEETQFDTTPCSLCESKVVIGNSAPKETFESHGYAVLIGQGDTIIEPESEGNWDTNIKFEISEDNNTLPNVEGHVVCESCAKEFLGVNNDLNNFYGNIPDEISPNESIKKKEIIYTAIAVLVLLVIISVIIL